MTILSFKFNTINSYTLYESIEKEIVDWQSVKLLWDLGNEIWTPISRNNLHLSADSLFLEYEYKKK